MTRKLTFFQSDSFVGLETRRELETKYAPQVFLGSILGTRLSAVGHFFPVPINGPRSLCESLLCPAPFSFYTGEMLEFPLHHVYANVQRCYYLFCY